MESLYSINPTPVIIDDIILTVRVRWNAQLSTDTRRKVILQLAYLIAGTIDEESWSGGLLVTDDKGLPLDFRYVEPIRPTKIQRLIYGGSLQRYLLLEAIGSTLLRDTSTKAKYVFTSDPLLLELETQNGTRFVSINKSDSEPLMVVGEWHSEEVGSVFVQLSTSGPPFELRFNADDENATSLIADELSEVAKELNFSEPLERVGQALEEICRNGTE